MEHGGDVEGGEEEGLVFLLLVGLLAGEHLDAAVHALDSASDILIFNLKGCRFIGAV